MNSAWIKFNFEIDFLGILEINYLVNKWPYGHMRFIPVHSAQAILSAVRETRRILQNTLRVVPPKAAAAVPVAGFHGKNPIVITMEKKECVPLAQPHACERLGYSLSGHTTRPWEATSELARRLLVRSSSARSSKTGKGQKQGKQNKLRIQKLTVALFTSFSFRCTPGM